MLREQKRRGRSSIATANTKNHVMVGSAQLMAGAVEEASFMLAAEVQCAGTAAHIRQCIRRRGLSTTELLKPSLKWTKVLRLAATTHLAYRCRTD